MIEKEVLALIGSPSVDVLGIGVIALGFILSAIETLLADCQQMIGIQALHIRCHHLYPALHRRLAD